MREIKVDKISPQSGTALAVGDSGDTITIPSGATITNSGTATGFGGGIVKQVVQNHVDTASTQSLTSGVITNISNLSASITPTSSSSKILVAVRWNGECTQTQNMGFGVKRGSTDVGYATAYSSAPRCIATPSISYQANDDSTPENAYFEYIDSPSTSSSVTYYATVNHETTVTIYHNRCVTDNGSVGNPRATSSITLTELTSATTQLNGS